MPMCGAEVRLRTAAAHPPKYRAMIESTTAQIPIPALMPPVIAFPFAGVVAEAKIAMPKMPNITSIATNTKVDAFIIANGFSCQEQIRQLTNREALHIAQVIQFAMHNGAGLDGGPREQSAIDHRQKEVRTSMLKTSGVLVSGAIAAAMLWYASAKTEPEDSAASGHQN